MRSFLLLPLFPAVLVAAGAAGLLMAAAYYASAARALVRR